tara:strand:+ start:594 stop:1802 length:1209 start_codon:yes stop_codon:yes gene_type:complete
MEGVKYYDITGRVVEEGNNLPLKAVKLTYGRFNDFTDNNGKFVLKITVKVDDEGNLLDKFTFLTLEKEGYSTRSVLPLTLDNKIKTKLNLTKLTTEKKQTEKDIAATSTVSSEATKAVAKGSVPSLPTPQKAINKAVQSIQDRLLPYIIGILSAFGITQIKKWLEGQNNLENTPTKCPSQASLRRQISKRNKVVRQLNNLYKIVDTATKAIGIALGLIKIFQLIINIFGRLPIPSTFGTPPGPAGGVVYSYKVGQLIRFDEKYDKFKGKLKLFSKVGTVILTALILLRFFLKAALDLLKIADQKISECAENNLELEEISVELLAIQEQEIEDGNPIVTNVNGFEMAVQPVPKTEVGSLIKRQAIAKDSKGIIVLKGEPSFSATDQILIDELAFYITNNNLKA